MCLRQVKNAQPSASFSRSNSGHIWFNHIVTLQFHKNRKIRLYRVWRKWDQIFKFLGFSAYLRHIAIRKLIKDSPSWPRDMQRELEVSWTVSIVGCAINSFNFENLRNIFLNPLWICEKLIFIEHSLNTYFFFIKCGIIIFGIYKNCLSKLESTLTIYFLC